MRYSYKHRDSHKFPLIKYTFNITLTFLMIMLIVGTSYLWEKSTKDLSFQEIKNNKEYIIHGYKTSFITDSLDKPTYFYIVSNKDKNKHSFNIGLIKINEGDSISKIGDTIKPSTIQKYYARQNFIDNVLGAVFIAILLFGLCYIFIYPCYK